MLSEIIKLNFLLKVYYLQGFAASFCCHVPNVFTFSPPNTDTDNLEEHKQDTNKVSTLSHVTRGMTLYHPLTRHAVIHDKENENPQIFRASPNAPSH